MKAIKITLEGQCKSGKNNMMITRFGKHYPKKDFAEWRDNCCASLALQNIESSGINFPVSVKIDYWAGDNRRRDVPGMVDALWHVLEKYGVVADDKFLGGFDKDVIFKNRGIDAENPRVELLIYV